MKKVISVIIAMTMVGVMAFAQPGGGQSRQGAPDWREKIRAEQVAFITSELNLTEAEAQAFWPVYNAVQKERREAFAAMQKAYFEMMHGADGADAAKLLDAYVKTKKESDAVENASADRYKKVLPVEKVVKLFVAEEKFRHQQIGRLGQGGGPGVPPQGGQGGGRQGWGKRQAPAAAEGQDA